MIEAAERIFELLPKNGLRLSGSQVKATLDLSDEEYKEAKAELKANGLVILGRGRSGTIAVTEIDPDAPDSLPEIAKMGSSASAKLWEEVNNKIKHHNCKCGLVPGMTYEELIELGAGCTGVLARIKRFGLSGSKNVGNIGGWVCPALSHYQTNMYKYREQNEEFADELELLETEI